MAVQRGSDRADPGWDTIRGIESVVLGQESIASGEAVVEIVTEAREDGAIDPPRARLQSYDDVPSAGETINAEVADDRRVAHTYGEGYTIELTERASETGSRR